MTLTELENTIQLVSQQLNTEQDLLGGLYGQINDQKTTVDKLQDKLNRLYTAHAALKGIQEIDEVQAP